MNANSTGALLDLCEILDIHEEGMAFQSPSPMEPGDSFSLCLDLTQPATYIHTSGRVMWSDPTGRTGLRFHKMPPADLNRFQEWLAGEAVSHAAEVSEAAGVDAPSETGAQLQRELHPAGALGGGSGLHVVTSAGSNLVRLAFAEPDLEDLDLGEFYADEPGFAQPGYSEQAFDEPILMEPVFAGRANPESTQLHLVEPSEVEPARVEAVSAEAQAKQSKAEEAVLDEHEYMLAAAATAQVGREIENYSLDLDAALQIIAERTQTLSGATGAAIALLTGEQMICRASAGQDAPPLGARLQTGSGFSGECIRTGELLYCDDSETYPKVDRESCRALGVRSILAAPVHSPHGVVGLVEVFSPRPQAFGERDKVILQHIARIVFEAAQRTVQSLPAEPPVQAVNESAEAAGSSAGTPEAPAATDTMADFSGEDIFGSDTAGERVAAWRKPRIPVIAGTVVVLLLLGSLVLLKSYSKVRAQAEPMQAQEKLGTTSRTQAQIASTDDLRKLAQAGDSDAQYELGVRYAVGADMPQDYDQAAHWFSAAAEQGHTMAQSNLGAYYWAGRGVPKDLNRAYFWALLAQAGGDEASRVRVPFLASRLSPSEILNDQQQADEWYRGHHPHRKPSPAK